MTDLVAELRAFKIATDPAFPIHPEICDRAAAEIDMLWMAARHACDVFAEPFGSKNPDKMIGDWRLEMLDAMRTLRALVPEAT